MDDLHHRDDTIALRDLSRALVQAVGDAASELARRRVLAASLRAGGNVALHDVEELHRFVLGPLLQHAHDVLGHEYVDLLLPRLHALLEDAWLVERSSLADWDADEPRGSTASSIAPPPDSYLPRCHDSAVHARSDFGEWDPEDVVADHEAFPTVPAPRSA